MTLPLQRLLHRNSFHGAHFLTTEAGDAALLTLLKRKADLISFFADCYASDEMKNALAGHTAAELEEMLRLGGGIADLAAPHLSEEMIEKLKSTTMELKQLSADMQNWYECVKSDGNLKQFFEK